MRVVLILMSLWLAGLPTARADGVAPVPLAVRMGEIARAAEARVGLPVRYDPAYVSIAFPMGDVPADTGVCTDVVIRTYRAIGVDLQELVNRDMRRAFGQYPKAWGLSRPDPNIDHRRVLNLETFLARAGASVAITRNARTYRAGDIVSWRLPDGRPHIGIVSRRSSADGTPLIVHNIGAGPRLDDILFRFEITGHFRWPGPER